MDPTSARDILGLRSAEVWKEWGTKTHINYAFFRLRWAGLTLCLTGPRTKQSTSLRQDSLMGYVEIPYPKPAVCPGGFTGRYVLEEVDGIVSVVRGLSFQGTHVG